MARVSLDVGSDGVAVITIFNPPVNQLAPAVLKGLKEKFDEADRRDDVKAIVVTGANGKFSGGFDITVLTEVQKTKDFGLLGKVSVELMIQTIEEARKPSVAAIDGLALGGGLELAMSCHARVSTAKAQLGLPELQLGIIPGFGGTQRLPRLVGLSKALEMILLSKPILATEGKELGLIDALVSKEELLKTASRWALDISEYRKPRLLSLRRNDKLESLSDAREIIKFARAQAVKTAKNMTHPLLALDAIEEGVVAGGYAGNEKEYKAFGEAVVSDNAKGLINVFFAQRSTSKVRGVTDLGLSPRPLKKAAVVGGGLMGSGIATALILSNVPVLLKEINEKFLQQGLGRIRANLESRVKKGKMTKEKMEKTLVLVKGVLDYSDFGTVDIVIEAVIENIGLKQQIFIDLEKSTPPHCVLASNTSTIDLEVVGAKIKSQDRIVGAHFFSPAHIMPLLEIVRSKHTAPQVILDLMTLGKAIKKVPVVVGNCTGFAVNRVFFPYSMASGMLLDLGVHPYHLDAVIKDFGMPMGPFALGDLVGFGVTSSTVKEYERDFAERIYVSQFINLLMKDGRLGQGNGKGVYLYDEKRRVRPDPEITKFIQKSQESAKIMPGGKAIQVTPQEIVELIFFPVVNEASRIIEEGVVTQSTDLDIASVLGMGFPPYRGGIVFWGDMIGLKYIVSKLNKYTELYGKFFKPSSFLEQRAASGMKLSDPLKSDAKSRL